MAHTANEMMTIAAARALRNSDICFVGIGMPSAACNLARLTHAPDITLIYESGTIATKPDLLPLSIGDGELCDTALTTVHLAWAYDAAGRPDRSLPLYEESLEQSRTNFNPDHPYVVAALRSLLTAHLKAGARDKAARLLPELLASTRKQVPADNPQLAGQLAALATELLRATNSAGPIRRSP